MQKLLLLLRHCIVMSCIIGPTAIANTLDWIQPDVAPLNTFFRKLAQLPPHRQRWNTSEKILYPLLMIFCSHNPS